MHQYVKIAIMLLICTMFGVSIQAAGVLIRGDDNLIHINDLEVTALVDEEQNTVTLILDVQYVGETDRFVWLIPVPDDNPKINFDAFDLKPAYNTYSQNPVIEVPPQLCDGLFTTPNVGSGGPERDRPAASEYVQFEASDTLLTWLDEQDYYYSEAMIPVIEDYIEAGMSLIAMPMSQSPTASSGTFQLISITYHSDDLSVFIPLRLTTFSSGSSDEIRDDYGDLYPRLLVTLNIFADTQYAPVNVPHVALDFEQLYMSHPLAYPYWGDSPSNAYLMLWRDTLSASPAQSFVTTSASPRNDFLDYPYVTVLRAHMLPDDMLVDPIFLPAPDLPDLAEVDLTYRDALQIWRCSTRLLETEESSRQPSFQQLAPDLPEGRTHLSRFGETVAYPADWVMSEFTLERPIKFYDRFYDRDEALIVEFFVTAFAPEEVRACFR